MQHRLARSQRHLTLLLALCSLPAFSCGRPAVAVLKLFTKSACKTGGGLAAKKVAAKTAVTTGKGAAAHAGADLALRPLVKSEADDVAAFALHGRPSAAQSADPSVSSSPRPGWTDYIDFASEDPGACEEEEGGEWKEEEE